MLFSNFAQVLMSHNLFVLCVAAEKIPGLSREGSPHSATSNKVSDWQERNTSLCVSFTRVLQFNSLYITDFMYRYRMYLEPFKSHPPQKVFSSIEVC